MAKTSVVVVGAGHNGLVAAAYLAKAGAKVTVLERSSEVGGILRNTEIAPGFTAPGVAHTVGRLRASVIGDLRLTRHGLELIEPDVRAFAPQPDGPAVTFWSDPARTAEELRGRSEHDAEFHLDPRQHDDSDQSCAQSPGRAAQRGDEHDQRQHEQDGGRQGVGD